MTSALDPPHARDATLDDLDAILQVRTRSFWPSEAPSRERSGQVLEQAVTSRRAIVGTVADRVVAYGRIRPFAQLWGGRPVPMAGVAGVVVAPEQRGRGVGTVLLRALLDRAVDLGDPLSALYPATVPPYRRLGWEWGGVRHRVSLDTALLRGLGGRDTVVRPAGTADAEEYAASLGRWHARAGSCGPLVHDAAEVSEQLEKADLFGYLADDGVLLYGWHGDGELVVYELAAGDEPTARALWSVVGSGSSTAATVHAYLSPRDPLPLLLSEATREPVQQTRWMLRVLDLPAAIAARGFPAGVAVEVPLVVDDALAPRCSGPWLLRVSGGRGQVTATPADGVRVGPNGLAALFAGTPMVALRTAGLASGGDEQADVALDMAFAAEPYLLDYF